LAYSSARDRWTSSTCPANPALTARQRACTTYANGQERSANIWIWITLNPRTCFTNTT